MAMLLLVLSAVLATGAGIASGQPWVLIALSVLPAWLIFLRRLKNERRASALWLMVVWATAWSVSAILFIQLFPEAAAGAILHGPEYRAEMFHWIETGQGSEGDWHLFLPRHALHYGLFLLASALTAGAGGLLLGVILLGYMNYYVAALFLADPAGGHTMGLALMGWHVWAVVRVIGFIAGAVAMADLTLAALARLRDRPGRWPGRSSYFLSLSLALVILDALLKALLASHWQMRLAEMIRP
jgi:hypothetical protein